MILALFKIFLIDWLKQFLADEFEIVQGPWDGYAGGVSGAHKSMQLNDKVLNQQINLSCILSAS